MKRPEFLTASNIMTQHGFFTRNGGVSEGQYTSLNAGLGSQDAPPHIMENRRLIAKSMKLEPEQLCSPKQVHGNKVLTLTEPLPTYPRPEGDAMVTNVPNIGLGIMTADCCPILLHDPKANVIGAVHAGWKSAYENIMSTSIEAMVNLGASTDTINMAIGPTIAQESYEVGPEFYERFIQLNPDNDQFFIFSRKLPEQYYRFDLPGFVASGYVDAGINPANIIDLKQDTLSQPKLFYSNRFNYLSLLSDFGRMLSVIRL